MIKLIVLAAILGGSLSQGITAPQKFEIAQDDGGDLNPQPLPPIAEEGFVLS